MELVLINKLSAMSKGDLQLLAQAEAEWVKQSGEVNPLTTYINAKRLEIYVAELIIGLKELAQSEADKYGKSFELAGAKCQLKNGNATLDYEADEVYRSLKAELKKRKDLLDSASKTTATIVDECGNDVPRLNVNFSKSSLTITL